MTKMSIDWHAELIKSLRNEFEHTEEYKRKVESQWLKGVSLRQETSAKYTVRVTTKTSSNPYIDGMAFKIFLVNGRI